MKSKLSILIIMQIRDLLDLEWLKSKRKSLFKFVFLSLGIGLFSFLLYLVFSSLYMLTGILVTKNILMFVLSILFILSLFSCTLGLNKSLYQSSDNILLLSFPTRPNQVYLSKLIVYYFYELRRNLAFFLSFFIGYGLFVQASISYYLSMIFIYLLTIFLTVLFGALISIPLMLFKHMLDQYGWLKLLFYGTSFGLVYYFAIALSRFIPAEFRLVAEWNAIYGQIIAVTDFIAMRSLFIRNIVDIVVRTNLWQNMAIIALLSLSLFLLAHFVSRPLYFRLASRPLESRNHKMKKTYINLVNRNSYLGFLKKEALLLWRNPERFISEYIFLLVSPLVLFYFTKVISAMPLAGLGFAMQKAFAIFLIIVILVASNTISAVSISSEGKAFYVAKTMPISTKKQIWAKMTINIAMNIVAIVSCSLILYKYTATQLWEILSIIVILGFIGVGHIFWAVEIDIRNPKVQQYATNEQNIDTSNGSKAIAFGIITGLIFTVGIMKNLTERLDWTWIKIGLLACVFFVLRLYLLMSVESVLFEEIE